MHCICIIQKNRTGTGSDPAKTNIKMLNFYKHQKFKQNIVAIFFSIFLSERIMRCFTPVFFMILSACARDLNTDVFSHMVSNSRIYSDVQKNSAVSVSSPTFSFNFHKNEYGRKGPDGKQKNLLILKFMKWYHLTQTQ